MPPARIALWIASIGGLALLGRTLLEGPLPLWLTLGAFCLYVALAMTGAMFPRLEMYGDVLCRGSGNGRRIALTFDDGPDPETTPRVLDALERAGMKGTFFLLGEKAERNPEIARAIVEAGHEVGLHGYTHDRLFAFRSPGTIEREIRKATRAIEVATGEKPRWFRPPLGHVSPRTAVGARRAGVDLVGWSVRGLDGLAFVESAAFARRIRRGLRPGAIVLMHDASEKGDFVPAAIAALPVVLAAVRELGLVPVTLDELLDEGEPSATR